MNDLDQLVEDLISHQSYDLLENHTVSPERLRPYHRRLIDGGAHHPELFRAMNEETARYILSLIEAGTMTRETLLVAFAGGATATAVEAFRRWRGEPPAWASQGRMYPLAVYPHFGGWELDTAGQVRHLTSAVGFALVDQPTGNPSVSGGMAGGQCGGCGLALWRLFDVDSADLPDVVGPTAGRVAVTMCVRCCDQTVFFTEYDEAGYRWAPDNGEPDFQIFEGSHSVPAPRELWLGGRRPDPYAGTAWAAGGSTLGGGPDWIQDPDYPACPRCGRTMAYLGMVTGGDVAADDGEGCYYAFVDPECHLTATLYQQS